MGLGVDPVVELRRRPHDELHGFGVRNVDAERGCDEERPINCITWYEAYAFCSWDGGFLPSEAEWNYAAAGGAEQRIYPWGAAPPTPSHASYSVDATQQCMGDGVSGCTLADLIPVGTKPPGDGKYGQSDLAGNLMEWTSDWDDGEYPNRATTAAS